MKQDWKQHLIDLHNQNNPEVPEHIWQNVKPFLPKKPNQDRFLLLLLSGVFLMSLGANYLYHNYNFNTNISKTSTKSITENCDQNTTASTFNSLDKTQNIDGQSTNETISKKNANLSLATSPNISNSNIIKQNIIVSNKLNESSNDNSNLSTKIITNEQTIKTVVEKNLISDQTDDQLISLPIRSCLGLNSNIKIKTFSIAKGECYSFSNKNKAQFFAEAYAGPLFAPYSLSASNPENAAQINRRNRTESSKLGYLGGARLGIQYNAWSFRLGAEFQSIYEQMSYKNKTDFKVITVRDSGGSQISIDTIWGEKIIKYHNYHRLINIPISIGHTFRLGNNNLTPILGIAMNVYSVHKGALLDSLNDAQIFTTGKNPNFDIYKTQLNLSASFSLQYSVLLTNYSSVFFEPGIQYYFKPFNKSSYPIDQKYISTHLKIGMRYNF